MCLTGSRLINPTRWNWDGDRIIHECIVPSSRPVVGARSRRTYDIDVREFLVTDRNEVMKRVLAEDVRRFIEQDLEGASWERFTSRAAGSFDHRADVLAAFVGAKVRYDPKDPRDPWQFPDETLVLRAGDCEDRAFLLASLLLASGVSGYNVRVALGVLRVHEGDSHEDHDHVWVMYKSESGRWMVLEPGGARPRSTGRGRARSPAPASPPAEYRPWFLFNDAHLWEVAGHSRSKDFRQIALARQWSRLDPKFIGSVHQSILHEALPEAVCPPWVLEALNRSFRRLIPGLVGPIIDELDRDGDLYEPSHHFDNGYIQEGWAHVASWLQSFRENRDLTAFGRAAHAIADFYAHSSYVHFARIENGAPPIYDPAREAELWATAPDYSAAPFDLVKGPFSVNIRWWKNKKRDAIPAMWQGQLISGRYAQYDDPTGDIFSVIAEQGATFRMSSRRLSLPQLGSLPHHAEIAVDDLSRSSSHRLYSDNHPEPRYRYGNQFRWRKAGATRHIRQAFMDNWRK